jgi:hypothetical protein
MARIKTEEIVDHLSDKLKKAMADCIKEHIPDAQYDPTLLYRSFRKSFVLNNKSWIDIPDRYVDKD